jgi:hypothetical protein
LWITCGYLYIKILFLFYGKKNTLLYNFAPI